MALIENLFLPFWPIGLPLVGSIVLLLLHRFKLPGSFLFSLLLWSALIWSVWTVGRIWPPELFTTGQDASPGLAQSLASQFHLSLEGLFLLKILTFAGLLFSALTFYHGRDRGPVGLDLAAILVCGSSCSVLLMTTTLTGVLVGVFLFGLAGPLALAARNPSWSSALVRFELGFGFGFSLLTLGSVLILLAVPSLELALIREVLTGSSVGSLGITLMYLSIAICLGWGPFNILFGSLHSTAPTLALAYLDVFGKMGLFLATANMFPLLETVSWGEVTLVELVGTMIMIWGAMGATGESRLSKLFYFSGLVLGGFVLMAGDPEDFPLALSMYVFTYLGLYCAVCFLEQNTSYPDIHHLAGLGLRLPYFGILVALLLLSMAGLPPSGAYLVRWIGNEHSFIDLLTLIPWLAVILASMRSLFLMYAHTSDREVKVEGAKAGYYVVLILSLGALISATMVPRWYGG